MADSKLQPLLDAAAKATPGPWTKTGSAKRTLFTTAQGQQKIAPDKAFLPVEIVTCLRHAEQAHADCDFIAAARNSISEIQRLVSLELRLREYVVELKAECADKGIAQPIAAAIRREIADRIESLMEGKP